MNLKSDKYQILFHLSVLIFANRPSHHPITGLQLVLIVESKPIAGFLTFAYLENLNDRYFPAKKLVFDCLFKLFYDP